MNSRSADAWPEPISVDRLIDFAERGGSPNEAEVRGDAGTLVRGIAYDSRKVESGDLFCCVTGFDTDGHRFAVQAVAKGAVALLVEHWVDDPAAAAVPQVKVDSVRYAMALVSVAFFRDPSAQIALVGITGTNGKTSTAYMVEEIFRGAGRKTGLTGTVETHIGGEVEPVARTTPESPDLQRLLWRMVGAGVEVGAMEVSSHALALDRVVGTNFAAGVFTNLTQDHLDFHLSMDDYYESKLKMFDSGRVSTAILNLDDPWSKRVAKDVSGLDCLTFSRQSASGAQIWSEDVVVDAGGTEFTLDGAAGKHRIAMKLRADFAVSNALASAAAACALGADGSEIAKGLGAIESVPGRFEPVDRGQDFLAVVDYAHTPDAVSAVLGSARAMARDGRVIVVVGCGGDRDRSKRPLMARAAVEGSDEAIFTSDNPRSEDPDEILAEMVAGVAGRSESALRVIANRREAISAAVGLAREGDVVVIAGKGHETGQTIAGVTHPFDDRLVLAGEIDDDLQKDHPQ